MTESIDPAIPLDTNESVRWSGRPRITTILPAVVIGVLLLVSGIVVSVTRETLLFLAVVPLGGGDPVWKYFALQGVQYVITDEALYVKRGVLTRSVTQAKPRNRPEQLLWAGYRDRSSDTAQLRSKSLVGTTSRSGRSRDPRAIRALVDRAASNDDGLSGDSRRNPVSLEICRSGSKFVTDPSDSQQLSESSSSGTARR